MMKKINFEKGFTRDFSIITESSWFSAINEIGNNPFNPINVYYINDGVIEVWECQESIDWILKKVKDIFFNNPKKIEDITISYLKKIELMKQSIPGDIKIIDLFSSIVKDFAWIYYVAINDGCNGKLKETCIELRDKEYIFDNADYSVRKALLKLHPHLKGVETGITSEEIFNPPSLDELKKRQEKFVYIPGEIKAIITLEEFQKKRLDWSFNIINVDNVKEFSGQLAFPGEVKGRCRIVKRKNQINEFQDGEILVSPMTTPNFLSIMKKASAIITDEGGMLCHAAILSRELKIPCVIGTKIATQILKTGDIISVNSKAIIKKI